MSKCSLQCVLCLIVFSQCTLKCFHCLTSTVKFPPSELSDGFLQHQKLLRANRADVQQFSFMLFSRKVHMCMMDVRDRGGCNPVDFTPPVLTTRWRSCCCSPVVGAEEIASQNGKFIHWPQQLEHHWLSHFLACETSSFHLVHVCLTSTVPSGAYIVFPLMSSAFPYQWTSATQRQLDEHI